MTKGYRPDRFHGDKRGAWEALLGIKRPEILEAVRWAEAQRENPIDGDAVSIANTSFLQKGNVELQIFLATNTADEPRSIVKGCPGNGLEA